MSARSVRGRCRAASRCAPASKSMRTIVSPLSSAPDSIGAAIGTGEHTNTSHARHGTATAGPSAHGALARRARPGASPPAPCKCSNNCLTRLIPYFYSADGVSGGQWGQSAHTVPYTRASRPRPEGQQAMYFVGKVEYQLDDRKRVPIPPDLPGRVRCRRIPEHGHRPVHSVAYARVLRRYRGDHRGHPRRDGGGRRCPPRLLWLCQRRPERRARADHPRAGIPLSYAGLSKDVVVVGVGDKLEIGIVARTWLASRTHS